MRFRGLRTLFGRNVALLIAVVLVSQIASVAVFMIFVQKPRIDDAASLFAAQITTVNRLLSDVPDAQRDAYVRRLSGQVDLPGDTSNTITTTSPRRIGGNGVRLFLRALAARLPADMQLRWQTSPTPKLWVQVHIGSRPYWLAFSEEHTESGNGAWIAVALSLSLAALATLAAYFLHRRINRPLEKLVEAAGHLGRGGWPEPLPVIGPTEIASVSAAFNRMTESLREIDQIRATMLAGISHDIRTPLTKLRLALAIRDSEHADGIAAERFVDAIDVIVQQFIDFGRGGDGEAAVDGDLNDLISRVVADFAGLGYAFTFDPGILPGFPFRPVSMLRVLMNLLQNTALYGRVEMSVKTWQEAGMVCVAIHDRGPGIPDELLTSIKQPFRRGPSADPLRSGTGLGLAIANRIVLQHGGSLDLYRRERGGLTVCMRLPVVGAIRDRRVTAQSAMPIPA